MIDRGAPWEKRESDPSLALAPYTRQRLSAVNGSVRLLKNVKVLGVTRNGEGYRVIGGGDRSWSTETPPILATGFSGGLQTIQSLLAWSKRGHALLTPSDESTVASGLFVCGPQVRHKGVIFCFIYKFRQRFAVVATEIAGRLGLSTEPLEQYRRHNMYLDDLSCCGRKCEC